MSSQKTYRESKSPANVTPSAPPAYVRGGHVLGIVLNMERVDHAQEGHERKNVGKDQAQAVHAAEHEFLPEEARHAIGPRPHEQAIDQRRGR